MDNSHFSESKHLLLPELLLPEPIPTITSIKHQHSYESSTKEPKPTTEAGTAKHRTRRPIPTVPSDLNGHIVGGHIIKSIDRDEQEKVNTHVTSQRHTRKKSCATQYIWLRTVQLDQYKNV